MITQSQTEQEKTQIQRKTKRVGVISTWIYLIFFPFFFYIGMMSPMVFDNPNMTPFFGLSIIFVTFLIPLSMPFSIYLIWSRYLRGHYKRVRLFCFLPIFTFIGAFIIIEILGAINRLLAPD